LLKVIRKIFRLFRKRPVIKQLEPKTCRIVTKMNKFGVAVFHCRCKEHVIVYRKNFENVVHKLLVEKWIKKSDDKMLKLVYIPTTCGEPYKSRIYFHTLSGTDLTKCDCGLPESYVDLIGLSN